MRRNDREITDMNEIIEVMKKCDICRLALNDKGYCTFAYESVIGKGNVAFVQDDAKAACLQKIMDHYHPGENAYFNPDAIPRTLVYKLTVEEITGKRKEIRK